MSVWNDITLQVENLHQVVERLSSDSKALLSEAADLLRKKDRIIFTGVGSGLNPDYPCLCLSYG